MISNGVYKSLLVRLVHYHVLYTNIIPLIFWAFIFKIMKRPVGHPLAGVYNEQYQHMHRSESITELRTSATNLTHFKPFQQKNKVDT